MRPSRPFTTVEQAFGQLVWQGEASRRSSSGCSRSHPGAVDILAYGGDALGAFKNGFIQAIVVGPLIGLSQSTALRDHTTRWMWWFAANVTTYRLGESWRTAASSATAAATRWRRDTEAAGTVTCPPGYPLNQVIVGGSWRDPGQMTWRRWRSGWALLLSPAKTP